MKKRSPLKSKPLRNPGQSLQELRDELLNDKLLYWMIILGFLLWYTAFEWWRFYNPKPSNPVLVSIMSGMFALLPIFRISKLIPQIRRLRLGVEGEKAVGQFLESLRESGYQVFHDLQGDSFNIDHAIIGRSGIYTIETKTLSKPLRGQSVIQVSVEGLKANGQLMERNPIIQAKAQSSWLRQLLEELSGKQYKVKPVVVFPGWFVEPSPDMNKELWVLEPKALVKFLEYEPEVLTDTEVKVLANSLSRYIRNQEK